MEMTTQNNKLIAEFMGLEEIYTPLLNIYEISETETCLETDLAYHTDWDWLMEVVDKIESLGYVHSIYGNFSTFLKKGTFNELIWNDEFRGNTKLEAVYISVIEFIKWYNEQNK